MVQALTLSCCSSSATSLHTLRTSLIVRQIGGWNLQRSLSWQMLDATGKEQKSRFSCFRALLLVCQQHVRLKALRSFCRHGHGHKIFTFQINGGCQYFSASERQTRPCSGQDFSKFTRR